MSDTPKKKYVYPYIPKNQQRPTACLCGRAGFVFRNGWICKRCDYIETLNAKPRGRQEDRKTAQPNAKYADAYRCGMAGFK